MTLCYSKLGPLSLGICVQVGLDGELKSALAKLDFKVQSKEEKNLSITTDFGKITHIQTDLFEVLHAMRIRVSPYFLVNALYCLCCNYVTELITGTLYHILTPHHCPNLYFASFSLPGER